LLSSQLLPNNVTMPRRSRSRKPAHRSVAGTARLDLAPGDCGDLQMSEKRGAKARRVPSDQAKTLAYDPAADSLASYHAAVAEIGRRVKAGEEPLPATGYFGGSAKLTKAANETHGDCLRIITRAEMRMADEIDAKPSAQGQRRDIDNFVRNTDEVSPSIADLGVSRQRLHEWRDIRDAGPDVVDDAIQIALEEGRAPTKTDILTVDGPVQ
jgi:hypothetical protein